ncbi:MAG: aminotransferase class III-fold pyridoxal phosphate-dependent enzyme [Bacteriovoracales bacterium]|nr:aminotransferase class III-fold pyridoxal phosphate-dependent enzyme [Bacteriovoracales bacterium]
MNCGVQIDEIQNQIDQLFSSILLTQKKFRSTKDPDPKKKEHLETFLDEYEGVRGRKLFFPYASTGRGHGPFTELMDGSVKYDLINGIGFNILGHSHPIQIKSALEAACLDSMMVGNLQAYKAPFTLSKILLDTVSDSKLRHFWFAGSGSFANDMALKILWQKKAPQYKLIALQKAFAGRSVATQEITASATYREGMPKYLDIFHVPGWDESDPEGSKDKTIKALDELLKKEGDEFCAITLELVQGEAGFIFGTQEYYRAVFDWAKDKNLYIWIDEIQTFTRTRELFAFQMFGLEKYVDVVTIGKALQGAGVLYSEELNPKPGLIAGTFNGSLPGIIMGTKTIKFLTEGGFYGDAGRMQEIEHNFLSRLKALSEGPCKGKLGSARGVGTMIAFEVGDASKEVTVQYIKTLFNNGIISFSAGSHPTRVRFLLPVCLTEEHIENIFQIIEKTTHEVIG